MSATEAMIARSMEREQERVWRGDKLVLRVSDRQAQEERHRELLTVLDRIATALEVGNNLTTDVMERT
jgi:hypothetical protein